ASAALLGLVALANGAKAIRPERSEALAERRAAEWVRERDAAPGFVGAARERLGGRAARGELPQQRAGAVGGVDALPPQRGLPQPPPLHRSPARGGGLGG